MLLVCQQSITFKEENMLEVKALMLAFVILFGLYSIVQLIYIKGKVKVEWFRSVISLSIGISVIIIGVAIYQGYSSIFDVLAMESELDSILNEDMFNILK